MGLPLLTQYFWGKHWSITDTDRKTGAPTFPRASTLVYCMIYGELVAAAVLTDEPPTGACQTQSTPSIQLYIAGLADASAQIRKVEHEGCSCHASGMQHGAACFRTGDEY